MKAPVCSDNGKTVTTTYKTPFADWQQPIRGTDAAGACHREGFRRRRRHQDQGHRHVRDVLKFAASYIKNFAGLNPKFALSAGPYIVEVLVG